MCFGIWSALKFVAKNIGEVKKVKKELFGTEVRELEGNIYDFFPLFS